MNPEELQSEVNRLERENQALKLAVKKLNEINERNLECLINLKKSNDELKAVATYARERPPLNDKTWAYLKAIPFSDKDWSHAQVQLKLRAVLDEGPREVL